MDGVKVRDEKRVVGSIYAAERRRITEGCHSLTLIISISHRLPMGTDPPNFSNGPC